VIRTIAAILISAGIIYGIVQWKQAADRNAILTAAAGREAERDIEALSSLPQFIAYSVRHPGQIAAYVRRGRDAAAMDHCIEKEGADNARPMKGVSLEDYCGIAVLSIRWGF
jgi:hypothetical protein